MSYSIGDLSNKNSPKDIKNFNYYKDLDKMENKLVRTMTNIRDSNKP